MVERFYFLTITNFVLYILTIYLFSNQIGCIFIISPTPPYYLNRIFTDVISVTTAETLEIKPFLPHPLFQIVSTFKSLNLFPRCIWYNLTIHRCVGRVGCKSGFYGCKKPCFVIKWVHNFILKLPKSWQQNITIIFVYFS